MKRNGYRTRRSIKSHIDPQILTGCRNYWVSERSLEYHHMKMISLPVYKIHHPPLRSHSVTSRRHAIDIGRFLSINRDPATPKCALRSTSELTCGCKRGEADRSRIGGLKGGVML
ncbi:unnamed protein product [Leptosia nina]|uniref:Uncharacterized protein n=1 Tax=Leptosia nina TaxID=320188 RepID=A0AAV1J9E2_9NEOP